MLDLKKERLVTLVFCLKKLLIIKCNLQKGFRKGLWLIDCKVRKWLLEKEVGFWLLSGTEHTRLSRRGSPGEETVIIRSSFEMCIVTRELGKLII